MTLEQFLRGNDRIDLIEVVTFPPSQPNFVELKGPIGRVTQLAAGMEDIAERLEIGVLGVGIVGNSAQAQIAVFAGGRVLSFQYLRAPDYPHRSGVRIKMDIGNLIVVAGDMPYSIFFSLNGAELGRPEFPIDEYVGWATD